MIDLPFREIHLDFHTSGQIPGIGSEFDADEFADTLEDAHVNSVTCFSRGHHGWIYHETEQFPERRHPHLTCNLLAEQIEVCHERDIRVPIYITVQWDRFTSQRHPEWVVLDENGCMAGTGPFDAGFYGRLCLNSPYIDRVVEPQTIEVCETLPVDGIFFDIVHPTPCCCQYCVRDMKIEGFDPSDASDRQQFATEVMHSFQERMYEVVRSRHPQASVFFNSGHVSPDHRNMIDSFTHLELESLPSGGWGYMHFPVTQRYARTLDRDCLGMTGKFHTAWGDFHSYKSKAALEFECFNMLALGAKCSIGDQLHPVGTLEDETYELIGDVYERVQAVEPWCKNAEPMVDIGVMTPEEFASDGERLSGPAIGAARILQESNHQFDIIDSASDFGRYKLLILPDEIPVDDDLAADLEEFADSGGAIVASYKSGLNPEQSEFSFDGFGVQFIGPAPYSPDFIVPDKLGDGLKDTGHVMYDAGLQVQPVEDAQVLSSMIRPYFNRTWQHFCSHRHTPAQGPADYPGAVKHGNCIYLMHPLFGLYNKMAPLWCKRLVTNAMDMLLPQPLVRADAPSTALFALNSQAGQSRLVLHALHYIPERRGQQFDTIEDVIPIYDIDVAVRVDETVSSVRQVPDGQQLQFERADTRVQFTIPEISGYQVVEIQTDR